MPKQNSVARRMTPRQAFTREELHTFDGLLSTALRTDMEKADPDAVAGSFALRAKLRGYLNSTAGEGTAQ